jgi:hypothetical protein
MKISQKVGKPMAIALANRLTRRAVDYIDGDRAPAPSFFDAETGKIPPGIMTVEPLGARLCSRPSGKVASGVRHVYHSTRAILSRHRPSIAYFGFAARNRGHVGFLRDQSNSLNGAAKPVHCQNSENIPHVNATPARLRPYGISVMLL